MCCGAKAGSYLRLIDSCITQLKAQGPSRTCNESKEEEEGNCLYRVPGEVMVDVRVVGTNMMGGGVWGLLGGSFSS